MTRDPQRGSVKGRDDVQVQSADGYAVSVDVTVKYRIRADKAHKLYEDTGSGVKYKTIVRNEAQRACIGRFGQMKTEDFYNPQARREKAEEVKEKTEDIIEKAKNEGFDYETGCALTRFDKMGFPHSTHRWVAKTFGGMK